MSANFLDRLRLWLRANIFRRRYEREMRDEMSAHLDRATALLVSRGLPEADARMQARREFGDVAYHETEGRDARGTLWLDTLMADTRFALRHFARRPITTLVMFIILAVGMTITSLLFSWVHMFATQPPAAVALQNDLVRIRALDGYPDEVGYRRFEEEEFKEIRALSQFSSVAGWIEGDAAFVSPQSMDHRAVNARVSFVTDNYFDVLGVHLAAGAGLPHDAEGDVTNSAVAVIDYHTWQKEFQKSRAAIGSTLSLNGLSVTIVGVAPERFNGIQAQTGMQVWVPTAARPLIAPRARVEYYAFGRLRPGVSAAAATSAVHTIATRAGQATEERRNEKFGADVAVLLGANIDPGFQDTIYLLAAMLGGLGLIILLVTCTNVSALLTGMAAARRQEIAIRLSLGAARGRIIRQLLTESAVLALFAGGAAIGLVVLISKIAIKFLYMVPMELGIGWSMTSFTFAVALLVGVAFGLSPALHATRMALASVLRDSSSSAGGSRGRLQQGLVVAQIAFTQPLIVGLAGFLVLVLGTMKSRTMSDTADHVVTVSVMPTSSSAATDEEVRALMNRLLARVRESPGVENAVIDWHAPLWGDFLANDGATKAPVSLVEQQVSPDYFSVLGIPIAAGRAFETADLAIANATQIPIIIGVDLATHMWGNANPIGRRLLAANDSLGAERAMVVVGVVNDPIGRTRMDNERFTTYIPADTTRPPHNLLVRTTTVAQTLLPRVREIVNAEAPGSVNEVNSLAKVEDDGRRLAKLASGGISLAGAIALTLAAIGLYAVVAFSVAQRKQEIAVRLAVGARGDQIARKFVYDGIRLSAIGMAIGMPLSLIGLRVLLATSRQYSVPLSPVALITAVCVVTVAAAAAWIPARRAATVDPAGVLRSG
jgi:predicted permease